MIEDILAILARNPGATEASIRSYLRGEYGTSTVLDDLIQSGVVQRVKGKLYLAEKDSK